MHDSENLPLPDLVRKAQELAESHAFTKSCSPRTGALLRTLAAGSSRILELGSGLGVGSAWIASGMRQGSRLVSVELDRRRHGALQNFFADFEDVALLQGDWRGALPSGPFDLVFVDVGEAKDDGPDSRLRGLRQHRLVFATPGEPVDEGAV